MTDDDVMFEEEERAEKPAAPFWTVAIYLVDKAYGGPEEGGWYYTCGQRCDDDVYGVDGTDYLGVFPTLQSALAARVALQDKLDAGVNVGRRDISSVLSEGRYEAQAHNGHPPHDFPEVRPHYE